MKGTAGGIATVVICLLGVPLVFDGIVLAVVPHAGIPFFRLTMILYAGYGIALPFYFCYLLIKAQVRQLINKIKENIQSEK